MKRRLLLVGLLVLTVAATAALVLRSTQHYELAVAAKSLLFVLITVLWVVWFSTEDNV